MRLANLGMQRKWIYEGILEVNGHFAAMGFRSDDLKTIKIKIYQSAKTYSLLAESEKQGKGKSESKKQSKSKKHLLTQKITLHFPSGISDFFMLGKPAKEKRKLARLPSLLLEPIREDKKRGFSVFSFRQLGWKNMRSFHYLINRAPMLALESMIDSSRGRDFSEKLAAIRRVAPSSVFARHASALPRARNPRG